MQIINPIANTEVNANKIYCRETPVRAGGRDSLDLVVHSIPIDTLWCVLTSWEVVMAPVGLHPSIQSQVTGIYLY